VIIRAAAQSDLAVIERLWNQMIRTSLGTFTSVEKAPAEVAATVADRQAAGYAALVADLDGQPVGFGSYTQFRGGVGYRHTMESTILVDDAAQGRGVGRALMGALETHARAAGHRSMIAAVSGGNPGAIAFHRALGYADAAVLRDAGFKWDQWLDLHLMQKVLSPPETDG